MPRGVEKMELFETFIGPIMKLILAVAIIEGISYIPMKKELNKRDQRIWELEERIRKLEQDRQDS